MKPFFVGLALTAPTVAVLAYFSLQGRQEVRNDQQAMQAQSKVDDAKFDADFYAMASGKALTPPPADAIKKAEKARDALLASQTAATVQSAQDLKDLRESMEIASGERKPNGKTAAETKALKAELDANGGPPGGGQKGGGQ